MKVAESIRKLVPYQPGKPIEETQREYGLKEVIKLASNENALGTNPKVVEALKTYLNSLHRYPDGASADTKKAAARYFQVAPEWLALGNGSDELIALLIRIYCNPGDGILTTEKAFVAYKVAALGSNISVTEAPLKAGFQADVSALIKTWEPRHTIVFLANPNNPTGTYINERDLITVLEFFKDKEVLVCLDEAYFEFVRAKDYPSGLALLKKYPQLVLLRTMSKVFGLAGLRLGFLIAHPEIADLVNRVRSPFNINNLAQIGAQVAFEDVEFVRKVQELTWSGIDFLAQELKKMGLPFIPSEGNFLLVEVPRSAREVYEEMLKLGFILRPVGNYGLPQHLRISVGLKHENERMIQALKKVLGGS